MDYKIYLKKYVRDFMEVHKEKVQVDKGWILDEGHTQATDDCDLWKTPEGIELIKRETSFIKGTGVGPSYETEWWMLYEDMNHAIVDVLKEVK